MQIEQPELYPICELGKGKLFMMPKPRNESLEADITFYKENGVTKVVSLLCAPEIEVLEMAAEPDVCDNFDIAFENFQIKDLETPSLADLQTLNQRLKQEMEQGHSLAVHCHGGRGRSSIVAITLMVEFGLDVETARDMASEARGCAVPVNDLQLDFVRAYKPTTEN
ncbi:protein-tyrosine phosphatase family protein [Hydrogenovibrio kuenenii]|uniref:protein-tyrosine phosphatase family protein n=1 Tax=Hydrogenovibrio kuenenii TaxID=63658 RepID=UPI00046382E9|nr:dual specificity protein phosphatase family protein [Hydrogenovibrio kuenenii]